MCGLAHTLEGAGISTVVIGLVPQHVRAMKPPRALLVPFALGRPLGEPRNAALQHEVLQAALGLLDAEGPGPLTHTFETSQELMAGETEAPFACPVSLPGPTSERSIGEQLRSEIALLRPWFDTGLRERGYTSTGASNLNIDQISSWLPELAGEDPADAPASGLPLGETFKLAVEDLKAFYFEAATAQPGAAGAAELRNWFWDETVAAELLRELKVRLADHPDDIVRLHAGFTIIPREEYF